MALGHITVAHCIVFRVVGLETQAYIEQTYSRFSSLLELRFHAPLLIRPQRTAL